MTALGDSPWLDEAERLLLGAPLWVGPTGCLGLTLANRWRPRTVFVQITTYIDESGTHGGDGGKNPASPYMIMAGYTAMLGQWNRFDHKWGKHLGKHGLEYFHATEMNGREPPYNTWRQPKVDRFAEKCAEISDDNTLFGNTFRLDRADYDRHYIGGHRPRKLQLDTMYGLCFRFCLSFLPDFVARAVGRSDVTLNFILEESQYFGDAERVFRQVKVANIAGISDCLGTVTPGEKKKFYALQAADGLAYGAWHHDDRIAKSQAFLPQSLTLEHARAQVPHMRSPIFRGHADSVVLGEIKEDILGLIAARKRFGEQRHAEILARKAAKQDDPSGEQSS